MSFAASWRRPCTRSSAACASVRSKRSVAISSSGGPPPPARWRVAQASSSRHQSSAFGARALAAEVRGNVLLADLAPGRRDREAARGVHQLAHVARPGECHEAAARAFRQRLRLGAEFARGGREVVRQQLRDVARTLAQGGHAHADHVEPVQQVLAEQSLLHQRIEVLVRRRDHAHVDPDRDVAADAVELALREHAQQAHLQRARSCRRSRRGTASRRRPVRSARGASRPRR